MKKLRKVVIVGGGTSGWLAANHIGKRLLGSDIEVCLIESPTIPTIGVGEGTVPMMVSTLQSFGISEQTFITQCDATFKQSIKFINWLDKHHHGEHNYYHHLFEYPFPNNQDVTQTWLSDTTAASFAETVSFQHMLCEHGVGPKAITQAQYTGHASYAYHLNALKFAQLLKDNATSRFNVKLLKTNVTAVKCNDEGHISELQTDDSGQVSGDFFVDCSGFSSILHRQALGVKSVDVSDQLPIDKAITAQVPTSADDAIPPYTLATAHQAGWIWDIALTTRRGTGFVYASDYLTKEQAYTKFERYLGQPLSGLKVREIDMKAGFAERAWHKNCVALGLAQGFVEPLEATSILLTDFSAKLLAENLPVQHHALALAAKKYNEIVDYAWRRVVDFIQLHYYLSDRQDSAFWRAMKSTDSMSVVLKERLALWQYQVPKKSDFNSKYEVFELENYLYILYGMHFKPCAHLVAKPEHKELIAMLTSYGEQLLKQLPKHRALLNNIAQHGLQKI
ncbi:tryptophan halogenase family protein [Pseudoalteromonas ruthenica]|uniref:tryptophan halogenase family protein n=1 Tax=Pseudoalteromonas ruthenica TaxID=151081 RepID=UPI00242001C0|nr:tryptophan halogenase family protein [Pseudoalteromonas ruthenica]|tara:strand:+ start:12409 stop:13929 length:1521 start_codon:yes stop_codon:yes gene_type:complete